MNKTENLMVWLEQRYGQTLPRLQAWHEWILKDGGERELYKAATEFGLSRNNDPLFVPTRSMTVQPLPAGSLDSNEGIDRVQGMLVGMAVGDALGFRDEFQKPSYLLEKYGLLGICDPPMDDESGVFLYTDDTQMAVALAQGLLKMHDYKNYAGVREEFVRWMRSPENNRAPGNACMSGCREMSNGREWYLSGAAQSKGAGSVMRVFPVGVLYRDNMDALIAVSADQAMMTHRHPTGVLAAVLGAYVIALLLNNLPADETLVAKCLELSDRFPKTNAEMVAILRKLQSALSNNADDYTVSEMLGSGWIAEEALAISLWALLKSPIDYPAVIRRAVNFPGRAGSCDRDTVGAIAGAFAGAVVGMDGILPRWEMHIEKREMLMALGEAMARQQAAFSKHAADFPHSHGVRRLEGLE